MLLDKLKQLFHINSKKNNTTSPIENEQKEKYSSLSIFEKPENGINGEIDEPIYQGVYKDCWLLSGVIATSFTETGSEELKNSISLKSDGSVDITFNGKDKTYNISKDELEYYNKKAKDKTSKFSTGDDDMLAFELAAKKASDEQLISDNFSLEEGGSSYYIFKLVGSNSISIPDSKSEVKEAIKHFKENPDNCAMTLSTTNEFAGLSSHHGYAIKEIKDDNITLVNPADTTKETSISVKDLLNNTQNMQLIYADFEKIE